MTPDEFDRMKQRLDELEAADHAEAFHTGLWCGLMFTPAQIVAAVEKLMEKTDAD